MGYLSTKEIAKAWGVSTSRVVKLASTGRIKGAKLVGKSWMIPSDAEKPEDRRKKEIKERSEEPAYHFPLFYLGTYSEEEIAQFSADEHDLMKAQDLLVRGYSSEAIPLLENLIENTKNITVRIGALFSYHQACIFEGYYDKAKKASLAMMVQFEEEFPHKDELKYLQDEVRATLEGNEYYLRGFDIDPTKKCSRPAEMYNLCTAVYSEMFRVMTGECNPNTSILEAICNSVNIERIPGLEMEINYYISVIYKYIDNPDRERVHIKRAIDLAVEYGYYQMLAMVASITWDSFCKVLTEYPQEIQDKLTYLEELLLKRYGEYLDETGKTNYYTLLEPFDYTLVYYASRKYVNKEIAALENLSEATINNRYAKLYGKLNVRNKGELLQLIGDVICNFQMVE